MKTIILGLLSIFIFTACSSQKLTKNDINYKLTHKRDLKHTTKHKKRVVKKKIKKYTKHKSRKDVYIVKKGDILSKIAKDNGISLKYLLSMNKFDNMNHIEVGQKIYLKIKKVYTKKVVSKVKRKDKSIKKITKVKRLTKQTKSKIIPIVSLAYKKKSFNKSIRLTATAYTSHKDQTDSTPFLAAWNNKIKPGMKIIAVSPDLIKKYGLTNGTKVKIKGIKHQFVIRDKMNSKWKNRIDVYMGLNKYRAYQWGKREVTLIW